VDDNDLTRSDGEPTPRAEVHFTKFSVEMPQWIRLKVESTSPLLVGVIGSVFFVAVLGYFGGQPLLMAVAGLSFLALTGAFLYFIRRTRRHNGDSE